MKSRIADELARAVLRGDDLADVLGVVVRRIRTLMLAETAELVLTQEGVLRLRQRDDGCWSLDDVTGLEVLGAAELTALGTGVPQALGEQAGRVLLGVGAEGPALLVPLLEGPHPTGLLVVTRHPGGMPFDDDALFVAGAIGTEAARVVEYVAMRSSRDRVAALEERDRIARDLHDGIVQSLFAVGLTAQSLGGLDDLDDMRLGLGEAVQMVDATIRDLRAYVFGPTEHDGSAELGDVLRATAAGFGPALRRLEIRLEDDAVAALAPHGPDILQTVREALSNTARHAGARHVRLTVESVDDGRAVVVEVADDGRGFAPDLAPARGHGVANLLARAQRTGGTLTIDSSPGQGCCLRLRVPVAAAGAG